MSGLIISSSECDHKCHIFDAPLCKELPLWRRVVNIAFHIITFCMPLVLYRVISFGIAQFKRCFIPQSLSAASSKLSMDIGKDDDYVIDTTDFVNTLLKNNQTELAEYRKKEGIVVSSRDDEYIDDVLYLFWKKSFKQFEKILKEHSENPWQNKEVLESASELLRVGFVISERTFQKFENLSSQMRSKYDDKQTLSYINVLRSPTNYSCRTAYYCANVYAWIKCGVGYDVVQEKLILFKEEYIQEKLKTLKGRDYVLLKDLDIDESDEFYRSDTPQNKFRLLYNAYCDKFDDVIRGDPNFNSADMIALPYKDVAKGSFKARYIALSSNTCC